MAAEEVDSETEVHQEGAAAPAAVLLIMHKLAQTSAVVVADRVHKETVNMDLVDQEEFI